MTGRAKFCQTMLIKGVINKIWLDLQVTTKAKFCFKLITQAYSSLI